jgi:hypothetical protein
MFEQLEAAVRPPRFQPPRRARERLPLGLRHALEQENFAARLGDADPRGHDARVVDDDELAVQLLAEVGEDAVADVAGRPVVHEQPRCVAPLCRVLGDQLVR